MSDKKTIKELVEDWFQKWETGRFLELPISDSFQHTSPFGTIKGKKVYTDLVKKNKDKFLGYRFDIHDSIFTKDQACVRYTAIQGDFRLDVSEWFYFENNLIKGILAYYHIGEIREDRAIENYEN